MTGGQISTQTLVSPTRSVKFPSATTDYNGKNFHWPQNTSQTTYFGLKHVKIIFSFSAPPPKIWGVEILHCSRNLAPTAGFMLIAAGDLPIYFGSTASALTNAANSTPLPISYRKWRGAKYRVNANFSVVSGLRHDHACLVVPSEREFEDIGTILATFVVRQGLKPTNEFQPPSILRAWYTGGQIWTLVASAP